MTIVFDFDDIARRVGRKPDVALEPVTEAVVRDRSEAEAAVRTLKSLGYTYEHGAQMWKAPIQRTLAESIFERLEAAEQAKRNRETWDAMKQHLLTQLANRSGGWTD